MPLHSMSINEWRAALLCYDLIYNCSPSSNINANQWTAASEHSLQENSTSYRSPALTCRAALHAVCVATAFSPLPVGNLRKLQILQAQPIQTAQWQKQMRREPLLDPRTRPSAT